MRFVVWTLIALSVAFVVEVTSVRASSKVKPHVVTAAPESAPPTQRKPAMVEECAIPWEVENRVDKIVAGVAEKTECDEAMEYAESCAYGSSADAMIAGAVRTVCEKVSQKFMKGDEKATYKKMLGFCDRQYGRKDGTMYTSMNAFCKASAARFFAGLHAEGAE
jgi:hypothetical protein